MILRALLGIALVLAGGPLLAAEEILSYHSDIAIQQDASLRVVETIEVRAEGEQIRRGIYRDFPTIYRDTLGNITRVGFELLSVQKDSQNEPHHSKAQANGLRIYIGDANTLLEPGVYTYRLEYRTTRQLGFFDEHDQLYWNVNGNGWRFPIRMASANVRLPVAADVERVALTGFTGADGSTERFLTHRIVDERNFYYETTQVLQPHQGLTIVLDWPKGLIAEPDAAQQRAHFVDDNRHSLIAVAGLGLVLLYYLLVWFKVGKDPQSGVVMPLYSAPQGFSPASTRFIARMDYDKTCFTTALVNLALKGAISINQEGAKDFLLRRTGEQFEASAGEQVIIDELFGATDEIHLKQSEHARLRKAMRAHEASLREDYEKLYFMTNRRFFIPGILLSLATIGFSLSQFGNQELLFSTLFVGVFTMIPFLILLAIARSLLRKGKKLKLLPLLVQLIAGGAFFAFAGDFFAQFTDQLNLVAWPLLVSAFLLIAVNLLFEQWLKAPTLAGRKLLDRIEGLRLYLSVAEADEIAQQKKPQMSSDIYERFLPFAFALGVDNQWSQQLDRAVAAGLVEKDYAPRGFHMRHAQHSFSGFSDAISGSLDSAISAASTPPGSSSGSSGGSSGSGGGGGGGGGW